MSAAQVVALDGDEGDNGTVRYAWRARGGPGHALALRVHARSGRVYRASRAALPLRPHRAYDFTVRACDGGGRCGVARVRLRCGAAPRAGRPAARPALAVQAAELDRPGYVLALLQAADPDGDALYYDIVGR
ncbi:unnamed protein product [Leptidea sinapis]|uniref:Cadherin domain-containing protein n=1 Tax=Leptidea sinapis TaxID=189913 RepID=A0A5E4R707_9NEOP|nr:unnamed protein product [Leptidea sinapis]